VVTRNTRIGLGPRRPCLTYCQNHAAAIEVDWWPPASSAGPSHRQSPRWWRCSCSRRSAGVRCSWSAEFRIVCTCSCRSCPTPIRTLSPGSLPPHRGDQDHALAVKRAARINGDRFQHGHGNHMSAMSIFHGKYLRYTISIWAMQLVSGFTFSVSDRGFHLYSSPWHQPDQQPVVRSGHCDGGAFGNVASGILLDKFGRRNTLASFFLVSAALMSCGVRSRPGRASLHWRARLLLSTEQRRGAVYLHQRTVSDPRSWVGTAWAASWQRIGGIVAPTVLGLLLGRTASSIGSSC